MEEIFNAACCKFGVENFNDFQRNCINKLISEQDVFLSVRTGGGKSLVYQAFQYIFSAIKKVRCQVVVVTPLLSIMKEQCDFLNSIGFRATYIGRDSDETDSILEGVHEFLFTSPESLLGVARWREMLIASSVIRLMVVDEAHTVIHW